MSHFVPGVTEPLKEEKLGHANTELPHARGQPVVPSHKVVEDTQSAVRQKHHLGPHHTWGAGDCVHMPQHLWQLQAGDWQRLRGPVTQGTLWER